MEDIRRRGHEYLKGDVITVESRYLVPRLNTRFQLTIKREARTKNLQ